MSTVVIVMAMQAEAQPLIDHLKLKKNEDVFPKHFRAECYSGSYPQHGTDGEKESEEAKKKMEGASSLVHLVLNGKCHMHDVDIVGTVGAAVTTFAAIQVSKPAIYLLNNRIKGRKRT